MWKYSNLPAYHIPIPDRRRSRSNLLRNTLTLNMSKTPPRSNSRINSALKKSMTISGLKQNTSINDSYYKNKRNSMASSKSVLKIKTGEVSIGLLSNK